MPPMLVLLLIILPCAIIVPYRLAAEQLPPPLCDAAGVCTNSDTPAVVTGGKQIWADRRLFTDAPPLEVQRWLAGKPEMEGKFLVIEFWRTWCGACKRMTPLMNSLQKKFAQELVVIGITGESAEKVSAYNGPKKEYFLALDQPQNGTGLTEDSKGRSPGSPADAGPVPVESGQAAEPATVRPGQGQYEARFGVWGWPHVIILEPQYRTIIWEGFPGLKGYALTEAKIEKILAIGRTNKADVTSKK